MSLAALLRRTPRQLDQDDADAAAELDANDAVRRRQLLWLSGAGGVALVLGSLYIFDGDEPGLAKDTAGQKIAVSTDDLVNRNMSQREWMAASEGRLQSIDNRLKAVDGQAAQVQQFEAQLAAIRAENQSMTSDGQRVMSAYQAENDQLRAALTAAKSPPSAAGPGAMYGASAPIYQPSGAGATPAGEGALTAVAAASPTATVKLVAFEAGPAGAATRVAGGSTSYTDSPNYLPPNSIAKARVIVGVDASAGVSMQSDPLPVVLRITGPARSVYRDGKFLATRIEGCLVNGAARGDLSSEKVYVKLQRMTCPQANGRFAISDVKGFIAFGGKTGVRGRVVSREGSLASQAFFAGLVSSAGGALNTALNAPVATIRTTGDGDRDHSPNLGNVALRGLGGGAEQSGNNVAQYLIERAEQYQPVIEMPTGVDVEIVFLEGVYVRN